jgi:ABC-type transport system involved in multi-copper enzyme maturation permease subunit
MDPRAMKYLAILKDSLREAIDTKVMYFMIALSIILMLFIASIGYRPVPAEDAIPSIVNERAFRMVIPERGKSNTIIQKQWMGSQMSVSNIRQLTEASAPSARDYSFTLTIRENHPFELHQTVKFWDGPTPTGTRPPMVQPVQDGNAAKQQAVSDEMLTEFVKQQFAQVADLTVAKITLRTEVPPGKDVGGLPARGIYHFDIVTQGRLGTRGWLHDMSMFFGLIDPQQGIFRSSVGSFVYFFESTLINSIGGWIALLIGVVITAFFIPNMLRKGTIDMLLSKPIHRPVLLVYKYIGGLTFMFINSCIAIGGVWLILGLRSGVWAPGFFVTIFTLTFFFAILYAVSTLFAVLTRSPIVAILVTCVFWFGMFLVGQIYTTFELFRKEPAMKEIKENIPDWAFTLVDVVHFVLPRTSDLNNLNAHLVGMVLTDNERRDKGLAMLPETPWTESVIVSLAFVAVMLGLACWRFSTKDY